MSQENLDLVLGLPFYGGLDVVRLVRDAELAAKMTRQLAPLFHADFESAFHGLPGVGGAHTGLDGLRAAWLDWLAPWASYRIEVEEALDCGERVLVCYDVFAAPKGSTNEVKLSRQRCVGHRCSFRPTSCSVVDLGPDQMTR